MFLQIDFQNGLPIYEQVVRQVKFAIAGEDFKEGELVPSVREIARELAINPNTVARAFRQLQTDGVLQAGPRHRPGGCRRGYRAMPQRTRRTDPGPIRHKSWPKPCKAGSIRTNCARLSNENYRPLMQE